MQPNTPPFGTSDVQLQFLLEVVPVGLLVLNNREEIVLANPIARQLFGLVSGDKPPRRCGDFLRCAHRLLTDQGCGYSPSCPTCDLRKGVLATLAGTATPEEQEGETLLYRESGCEPRWIRYKINPLSINGRRGALLTVDDITASKLADESLTNSEALQRAIIAASPMAIITIGPAGKVLSWNSAAERIFGWPEKAMIGRGLPALIHNQPQTLARLLARMLAGEILNQVEATLRHKDGSPVVITLSTAPIRDDDGKIAAIVAVLENITNRKRVEEEMHNLQAQLIHSQKMEAIGTLAGGIAHDFNNILAAVLGYTEMARGDCAPGSLASQNLDKVLEATGRATALVRQILAFSRQEKNERIPIDPARIVKEAIKLLRPSLPSTIAIRPPAGSTRSILADPTQMHQIVMNLCTNAFHALEQTGGVLEISLVDTELSAADLGQRSAVRPGTFVMLTVADNGPGIAPVIRERIFDPYFTTKDFGRGTGLGLSIVHGIVTSHGGLITCESEPGQGAVFRVFLPAVDTATAQEQESPQSPSSGAERILLVDDEPLLSEMCGAMLEQLGYQVTAHTDSLKALAAFEQAPHQFDLVFTDQTMPGLTGTDLVSRLLRLRPDLPIILCTGYSNLINEVEAKNLGIKGFALKPLNKHQLSVLVRAALTPV